MKTGWNIYKHDIQAIVRNPATLIIIIGLIILPSMYAWFNIAALIDPYGNASNLPIAVYSQDQGVTIDGHTLNVGEEVITNLKTNKELAWQFPTSIEQLEDRVNTGEYYAAVIIPESFSSQLKDGFDSYQSPSIKYIVNEKVNAIAPKMTEAGAEGVTDEINSNINSVVTEYVVEYGNQINDQVEANQADYQLGVESLNQAINNFDDIDTAFSNFDMITDDVDRGIETIDNFNQNLEKDVNNWDYSQIYEDLKLIRNEVNDPQVIDQISTDVEKLEAITKSATIEVDTSQYQAVDSQITDFIYNQWPSYQNQIIDARDKLVLIGDDYNQIADYLQKDGDQASEFMANPIQLETETLYPVANYGSASAPFYTTLCLWVGSLLLVSLLSVESQLRASKRQQYLGKLMLFVTIGILQAVIVTAGDVLILDISVAAPLMLLMFDILIAAVFVTIVYTLVYIFGNIGKAMAIIILVLSISGGGGNFPIEVSGPFFNHIYPFLPFTYGVKLLREAGAGIYQPTAAECIGRLLLMAGIAVSFGLVSSNSLKKYFDRFDRKSRENHLIH